MKGPKLAYSASVVFLRVSALIIAISGLSACSQQPPRDAKTGEQFLGERVVETVYQLESRKNRSREQAPIKKDDEFEIVRESKNSNRFKFIPGENFENFRDEWASLELDYRPGIDSNEPVPIIAEVCTRRGKCGQSESDPAMVTKSQRYERGPVNADVQNDFLNLKGRGLEFLEGGPLKFNGEDHLIHIFHIQRIGDDDVSLLIFYCKAEHCNHNGAAHARRN